MDDQSHYIIGYGSLITKESRFNTGQTGKCMPVTIKNYCRSWTARINNKGKRYTAVSIHHSPGSIINAVITEIKSSELSKYDRREINYSRVLIPASNIKKYNTDKPLSKAVVWAYIINPKYSKPASYKFPILQSYVDVILTGCNRISNKFMKDFINSTVGWENVNDKRYTWVNDRENPYYNFKCNKLCHKTKNIDKLLKQNIPQAFYKRADA